MNNTEYIRPNNLTELTSFLAKNKDRATIIAGGTNLIPQMRNGEKSSEVLIDLSDMKDLSYIKEENGIISIGAATTIADIASSNTINTLCPILASAAGQIGNPLTRNRATIGGNLVNASPAADTAPPLLALEALAHIAGPDSTHRDVPLELFFKSYRQTDLRKGEILTHITIPKPNASAKGSFTKIGLRNASAISISSIAVITQKKSNICDKIRIALGSVAPTPIRAYRVEELLKGKQVDQKLIDECAITLREEISPIGDIRGSAEYRRYVTTAIFKRTILNALNRSLGI